MPAIPNGISSALGSGQTAILVSTTTVGSDTFYLLNVATEDEGGQLLAKIDQSGNVSFPAGDAGVLSADTAAYTGHDLRSAFKDLKIPEGAVDLDWKSPAGAIILSLAQLNSTLVSEAKACVNTLVTKDVPGTDGGNLACAWAVNEVARRALGRQIGGGLSTANMYLVLKAKHKQLSVGSQMPGNVIISPTKGSNVGHVGIVGPSGQIYSNSSSRAVFYNKYTLNSWQAHYGDLKGLQVLFYQLDPAQFPEGAVGS
ncbi:hypothetical protein [Mesorhizobium sp. WSM3626]|uniref:hypothetical protein n=1 Tax=Mesorhizobium sp. WSM3626 TaxID=1040987 RepID=UPI0004897277|nr:hypothetical protein [Mesorhizobium sp. WSM3626]